MEEKIPMKHTCDDLDISPPLEWGDPPEGTVSLAIALDDVSANGLGHWVLFNIPPETRSLPEGLPKKERLADGSQQTIGALTQVGYMGPCPAGSNRYRFRLLALDTMLDLDDSVMYVRVMQAIRGHVLAEAELYGVYH
jgi:Raf kinase inhibitor-like YbhB/YbcL family protein